MKVSAYLEDGRHLPAVDRTLARELAEVELQVEERYAHEEEEYCVRYEKHAAAVLVAQIRARRSFKQTKIKK